MKIGGRDENLGSRVGSYIWIWFFDKVAAFNEFMVVAIENQRTGHEGLKVQNVWEKFQRRWNF